MAEAAKNGKNAGFLAQAGKGRPKGVPNKNTAIIKDMILRALDEAGGHQYLVEQAEANPSAFMTLLGKVLPLQIAGDPNNPLAVNTSLNLTGLSEATLREIAAAGGKS